MEGGGNGWVDDTDGEQDFGADGFDSGDWTEAVEDDGGRGRGGRGGQLDDDGDNALEFPDEDPMDQQDDDSNLFDA
ncbi:MAG: hypothetical protein ACNI27_15725 [Desulfovibrio sp.]